jgi:hypothetical protein
MASESARRARRWSRPATVGLAKLVHMPNGDTFTRGMQTAIDAADRPLLIIRAAGRGVSDDGAIPKLHWITAPSAAVPAMSVAPLQLRTPDRRN